MKVYVVTSGEYSDYGIRAMFTERAPAEEYIKSSEESYINHEIEEWEAYDHLPQRKTWYLIERMARGWGNRSPGEEGRRQLVLWPWDGPQFTGQKRESWNYHRWEHGERAWGTDEAAVEKAWKEQNAAREALEAGL